jgi:hypothetical protein
MTNFSVYEGDGNSVQKQLQKKDVKVGDTIEFVPNNQEGYEKYEVINDEKDKKALKLIDSYDMQMEREYESGSDKEVGGKKKKRKGKSSKRKTMGGKKRGRKSCKRR